MQELALYHLFDQPLDAGVLGAWQSAVAPFTLVVGWTRFGDIFLRDPVEGRYAGLGVVRPRLVPLRYVDRQAFEAEYFASDAVIQRTLRRAEFESLHLRLGELGPEEVFARETFDESNASSDAGTAPMYRKESIWAFAARSAAAHGIGEGSAADLLLTLLRVGDDYRLWRVVVDHILAELSDPQPGTLVEIGRCSHWLRPHQTRWTADGGFAAPMGYGSGQGGFVRDALPQFDWSSVLTWTGTQWEHAMDKRTKPALRVTIPSRTRWHDQAAVHTLWMTGREKELRRYGFRRREGVWRCTGESEWREDQKERVAKRRDGHKRHSRHSDSAR